jgi:hypothetical protein
VLADLRQRYEELLSRRGFLPYEFNLRLPLEVDLDKVIAYVGSDFFATSTDGDAAISAPNRVALALALFGWQSLSNARTNTSVPNSASCHTCLRRLGLWLFKSKEINAETNEVITPAPMDYLDPVLEHRFFCPWKNGSAQEPASSTPRKGQTLEQRPAWELVIEMLRNEAYVRNRKAQGSAHARGKSNVSVAASALSGTVATGERPNIVVDGDTASQYTVDDLAARDAKDKERWARLRKVKSFFNNKDGKKLKRSSRPGTSASSVHGA